MAFPLSDVVFCQSLIAHSAGLATPTNHRPTAIVSTNFASLLSLPKAIANNPQKSPTKIPAPRRGLIPPSVQIASLCISLARVSGDFPFIFSFARST